MTIAAHKKKVTPRKVGWLLNRSLQQENGSDIDHTVLVPALVVAFLAGSRQGKELKLHGKAWRIGTAPECEILFDALADAEVEAVHAEIAIEQGTRWLKPLSTGRTWLNGIRAEQPQPLKPDDVLVFGAEGGPSLRVSWFDPEITRPALKSAVRVRIEKGEARQCAERFEKPFTIGRGRHCDVQFDNPSVSATHAEIGRRGQNWCVQDLNSTNGTFLNGARVEQSMLPPVATLELLLGGPRLHLEIEAPPAMIAPKPAPTDPSLTQVVQRYFGTLGPGAAGSQTMLIRRAFAKVRRKQSRRYWTIIGVVSVVCVMVSVALYYQHRRVAKMRGLAEDIFYAMKALEVQITNLQAEVERHPDPTLRRQALDKKQKQGDLETSYHQFARELGITPEQLPEKDWLVYKMARVFGECDVSMPPDFLRTVHAYIKKWHSTSRLADAVARAREQGYAEKISAGLLANDLPPQFFYLALKESNFDVKICGPQTARWGIAKGMWQFIPSTAIQFGLRTGPLVEVRQYDRRDERHDFEKSTAAAVRYLRYLYQTEAQASGLLVMASYNWGQGNVLQRIRALPNNPRERNFWRLLAREKIPAQTYDYVFYIVAAAVIGENPRLFGFDFDNPLRQAVPL